MRHSIPLILFLLALEWWGTFGGVGPCVTSWDGKEELCIPSSAINHAFQLAKDYFSHKQKHLPLFSYDVVQDHHGDIDELGMILSQTTKYLGTQFGLSLDQVVNLLPYLDLTGTEIEAYCPSAFQTISCMNKATKYREIDGRCNNLKFPQLGSSNSTFRYLLPRDSGDGVEYPKDPENEVLPSPRVVSAHVHGDRVSHDHSITVMLIAWGQLIDHDVAHTAETKDPKTRKIPDCCKYLTEGPHAELNHNCFPIQIPHEDPFYGVHGVRCMNFLRSVSGVRSHCRLGQRSAMNTVTSFLDASFVYGSQERRSRKLRTGKWGTLRSLKSFHHSSFKDLLPQQVDWPEEGCLRSDKEKDGPFCFEAGDHRVNEQLVLTALHTLFMREHNRIAKELAQFNPHWDDERLFQEARRIVIAITQHITYSEFLPLVLGPNNALPKYSWYNPDVNPSVSEEFMTSAFRFGHSLLPSQIERWSISHHFIESVDLHKLVRQPFDLYKPGYMDTYLMGMVNQLAQVMDEGITHEVTTLLFKKPGLQYGKDLAAMNIQRGRDHGIQGYTAYRELCGLSPPIHSWEDLHGVMKNETIWKYKALYRSPHDIDLWSGGVSEVPSYGSLVGPTFGCILAKQFQSLRDGDRFWYESTNSPSSFSADQLWEIKQTKLSRILCDNSDHVKTIQVYAMRLSDPKRNSRVPCHGILLPRIDLSKWGETNHYHGTKGHDETMALVDQDHHDPPQFIPKVNSYYESPVTEGHHSYVHLPPSPNKTMPNNDDDVVEYKQYLSYPEDINDVHHNHYTDTSPKRQKQTSHYKYDYDTISPESEAPPKSHVVYITEDEADGKYDKQKSITHILYQRQRQNPRRRPMQFVPPKKSRRFNPFPPSPFPGLGGIFSPNPGYLVKQKFVRAG